MKDKIEIKEMPRLEVAFVAQTGHKGMGDAYEKLMKWAAPKGLLEHDNLKIITIYHDSYKTTEPDKVRMSACISIDQKVETNGEIGVTSIDEEKCIVGHFEIQMQEFEKSWKSLFTWMSENGYKKANRDPFEIYHNNFNEHPQKISLVDFCIPIE